MSVSTVERKSTLAAAVSTLVELHNLGGQQWLSIVEELHEVTEAHMWGTTAATYDAYPVVIYRTRYNGTYEGCQWAAFNLDVVPEAAYADDVTCLSFWRAPGMPVGKGNTPDEAHADLCRLLRSRLNHPSQG